MVCPGMSLARGVRYSNERYSDRRRGEGYVSRRGCAERRREDHECLDRPPCLRLGLGRTVCCEPFLCRRLRHVLDGTRAGGHDPTWSRCSTVGTAGRPDRLRDWSENQAHIVSRPQELMVTRGAVCDAETSWANTTLPRHGQRESFRVSVCTCRYFQSRYALGACRTGGMLR